MISSIASNLRRSARGPMAGLLLVGLAFFAPHFGAPSPAGAVEQTSSSVLAPMTGFRNDRGRVVAFIFRGPRGFPAKRHKAVRIVRAPIKNGKAKVLFEGLSPGEYAVSVFHDEDGDDRLNLNWLGLPVEGLAISNGARNGIAYPRYSVARFQVGEGRVVMPINILYWLGKRG